MQTVGSVASIIASIREDAAAEVERIEQATAADIASIRTEETGTDVSVPDRVSRLATVRRENQERIAQQEWEGRRAMIEQREAWIARVVATARQEWRSTPEQLLSLIREALQNVDAAECEVAVAPQDRDRVDPSQFEKRIHITTADIDCGCIVTAGDITLDESFDVRAKRLEPEWRKALGEVYRP